MGLKCYRCSLLDVRHKFSTRVMLQSKVRSRPTDVFFIEREGLCLSHTSLLSSFSVSPSSSSLPVPCVVGLLPAYPPSFYLPLVPFFLSHGLYNFSAFSSFRKKNICLGFFLNPAVVASTSSTKRIIFISSIKKIMFIITSSTECFQGLVSIMKSGRIWWQDMEIVWKVKGKDVIEEYPRK